MFSVAFVSGPPARDVSNVLCTNISKQRARPTDRSDRSRRGRENSCVASECDRAPKCMLCESKNSLHQCRTAQDFAGYLHQSKEPYDPFEARLNFMQHL